MNKIVITQEGNNDGIRLENSSKKTAAGQTFA